MSRAGDAEKRRPNSSGLPWANKIRYHNMLRNVPAKFVGGLANDGVFRNDLTNETGTRIRGINLLFALEMGMPWGSLR